MIVTSAPISTRTDLSNYNARFPGTLILAAANKSSMESKDNTSVICRETSVLVVPPTRRSERQTGTGDAWLNTFVSQFHEHLELLLVDDLYNITDDIYLLWDWVKRSKGEEIEGSKG